MPIKVTPAKYTPEGHHYLDHENAYLEHQVVAVRTGNRTRNCSDTLDYTDYQTVECTEALAYMGRTWNGHGGFAPTQERPVELRFEWIDCTNLFAWRGADHRSAQVDPRETWVPGMAEDLAAYEAAHAKLEAQRTADRIAHEEEAKKEREEAIKNAPAVGKKMQVAKGRKVPVGFVGVVSYISGSGSCLLKAEDVWQDRKANGTWVDARNLVAC